MGLSVVEGGGNHIARALGGAGAVRRKTLDSRFRQFQSVTQTFGSICHIERACDHFRRGHVAYAIANDALFSFHFHDMGRMLICGVFHDFGFLVCLSNQPPLVAETEKKESSQDAGEPFQFRPSDPMASRHDAVLVDRV